MRPNNGFKPATLRAGSCGVTGCREKSAFNSGLRAREACPIRQWWLDWVVVRYVTSMSQIVSLPSTGRLNQADRDLLLVPPGRLGVQYRSGARPGSPRRGGRQA
jgi:hypothetical protein